jgi:hypothetical protein
MLSMEDIMKTKRSLRIQLAVALALTGAVSATHAAVTEGRTATGKPYLVGGVGLEESDLMKQHAQAFSVAVVTAARGGAYLADTHVRILGPGNNVVLDTVLEAPWLLVDLPTGRYRLVATNAGRTVERQLNVVSGKPQQIVLHYDVPVDNEGPQNVPVDTARSRMPQ